MSGLDGGRLRVAMVSYDFGEYCVPIANALSRSVEVVLILAEGQLDLASDGLDPAVSLVPFVNPRLRQPLRQAATTKTILRTLRWLQPDIVHLQQGHLWFNLLGLPRLGGRPLVVTVHDQTAHPGDRVSQKTPQVVMDLGFKRADQVVVHAEWVRKGIVERLGIEPDAVHVMPHVAIGSGIACPPAREEGRTVLFFGRIWPYKGLAHLIRAEPLITERVPDAHFVIAGQGEDFGRYRDMMGDSSRFTVLNEFVSVEKRAELFAKAAVVVLPYVEASQSGVVPIAYAHEKPVVATAVGGLPEAVEDGRTGLVVPPADEGALADAIVRLLGDPALRRRMGVAGREKLEAEWSAASVAERTLRVYERVRRPAVTSRLPHGA